MNLTEANYFMDSRVKNLTGQKFSMLTVKRFVGVSKHGHAKWLVACDCGVNKVVLSAALLHNQTLSCGCYQRKISKEIATTHGDSLSVEFKAWSRMLSRCNNPNVPEFKHYGARGIKVCKRWLKYENFLIDMGRRPGDKTSIDRINNNKGYSLSNCKWSTIQEQNNNKRSNIHLNYKGIIKTLGQWAIELKVPYHTLYSSIITRGNTIDVFINKKNIKWQRN